MIQKTNRSASFSLSVLFSVLALAWSCNSLHAESLRVCASTPDLGSLARTIGGDEVEVTVLVKGTQDPHNVTAKPSYIKLLHRADVLLFTGLDLEVAWLPTLVRTARNRKIYSNGSGFLDASKVIQPIDVPTEKLDRLSGDVHALGNPHYLLDPINGLRVAGLIARKFSRLRPEKREVFGRHLSAFSKNVMERLYGKSLVAERGATRTARWTKLLIDQGLTACVADIESGGDRELLAGWVGSFAGRTKVRAVADHQTWNYFAARFGVKIIGFMEPKPGITPTTKHLAALVRSMKKRKVSVVISSTYFDRRHVDFVVRHSGAHAAPLAHQAGARAGTDDYLSTIDFNVRQVIACAAAAGGS